MNLLILFMLLLPFISGYGKSHEKEDPDRMVVVPRGTIHQGDYFATGNNIEISGEVTGDLYLFGQQIVIDGKIHGDALIAGGTIDIPGEIGGNIRAIGGQILITGNVGHNVTLIGGNAQLISPSKILGSLVVVVGNCDMAASIGRNAMIVASNLRVSGNVENNLHAHIGDLRLTSNARVGGDLNYSSANNAVIDQQAQILGKTIHNPSGYKEILKGTWFDGFYALSKVAGILMNFLFSFVFGWVLIRAYPKKLEMILASLKGNLTKSFGYGLMIVVLLPLASLLLLITILGVPFALALMGFNVIFFYAAKTIPILAVSNSYLTKLKLKPNSLSIFAVGLACYFLLVRIPYVGILLALACLIFGLGASVISQQKNHTVK